MGGGPPRAAGPSAVRGSLLRCVCRRLDHADRSREQPVRGRLGRGRPYRRPWRRAGPALAGPQILSFSSYIITDALDAMRYEWNEEQSKFSFFLDPDIPYVVGAHAELVVDRLLSGAGLSRSDISHWLLHSGGKKVIDAVRVNLGLTRHDVRHTTGVLRDYGNLSSGSFLFSYERLVGEGIARRGDYGVLMTMGPGSTIETALVRW